MAQRGIEGPEIKVDTTKDINDIVIDIATLSDVVVHVLEKQQLDIGANLAEATKSSCVTTGIDVEGDVVREIDGGTQEAPIQDGEANDIVGKENETLFDIDDDEVKGYLCNDEEVRFKTIIWTKMNKEYLEEQEAKRVSNEASEKARIATFEATAIYSFSTTYLALDLAPTALAKLKNIN